MQNHQADSSLYVWPDVWSADLHLLIKSMIIHDTECPYWDQVSLNNTNQTNTYLFWNSFSLPWLILCFHSIPLRIPLFSIIAHIIYILLFPQRVPLFMPQLFTRMLEHSNIGTWINYSCSNMDRGKWNCKTIKIWAREMRQRERETKRERDEQILRKKTVNGYIKQLSMMIYRQSTCYIILISLIFMQTTITNPTLQSYSKVFSS